MSKYIHKFDSLSDYNNYRKNNYNEPWLSITNDNGNFIKNYNKTEYELLFEVPLTFEILSSGNIVWKANDSTYTLTIQYKKNDGEWTNITSSTSGSNISVVAGDTVQFRGNNGTCATSSGKYNSFKGTTCGFNVKGNIMSLINSTDFATTTTLASNYTFFSLFSTCTGLTDTSNLILPATTLTQYCYYRMFQNCTALTIAPKLPATTLGMYCYCQMFLGCNSLTVAPELPATTLANQCYYGMFKKCGGLVIGPSTLPATTLADYCYIEMFYECSSLTAIPRILPATTLTQHCYENMFYGCTSITTAPELPATTLAIACYEFMFRGCRNLITAPAILPATSLAKQCYYYMFDGCSSLTTAPELPATILTNESYSRLFSGCTNLNYIKCLATDISIGDNGTYNWVMSVSATGTFIKNPSMNDWPTGNNGIPSGWTVQDAS